MPILLQIPYRYSSGARCFPFFNDCLRLSTFFLLYLLHQKNTLYLIAQSVFLSGSSGISSSILRISLISTAVFNESSVSIRSYVASLFKGSTMFFDCFSRGVQGFPFVGLTSSNSFALWLPRKSNQLRKFANLYLIDFGDSSSLSSLLLLFLLAQRRPCD